MMRILLGISAGLIGGILWSHFGIAHGAELVIKARNNGVIAADDPNRQWFNRSAVNACCNYADGHFVPFRLDDNKKFEIQVNDKWWKVPDAAVKALEGEKNPYLEALAWWSTKWDYTEGGFQTGQIDIRCFIVGAGL
jgi:hypothetical protein